MVCNEHSGLDAKLSSINENLGYINERLTRIETKVEPMGVIGNLADDNRRWLKWLTGGCILAVIRFFGFGGN